MRRVDKAIVDEADIRAVIRKAAVCRLGMVEGDRPYVVPLCFGYRDNVLYFHGASEGCKIDILRKNPKVCFEFDLMGEPVASDTPCSWSMRYRSVIGFGEAVFVEGLAEKREALRVIMAQYADGAFEFPEKALSAISVFRVEIEGMTGKQSKIL